MAQRASWPRANGQAGMGGHFTKLKALWVRSVVLEATEKVELLAATTLATAAFPVAVVNPRQIRDFARAMGRLAKTDRLDAEVIAQLAKAVKPVPRSVENSERRRLGELIARCRQLGTRLSGPRDTHDARNS